MNVDLLVVGLVAFFALVGAVTGAARQVARLVAALCAGALARTCGPMAGPSLAEALQTSATVGVVIGSVAVFVTAYLAIRYLVQTLLLRLLAGKSLEDRGLDRALGFIFGGLKMGVLCALVLCALVFVEDNVVVGGKRLAIAPKDSVLVSIARTHNLFTTAAIPGMTALITAAKATGSKEHAALRKDPRFRRAVDDAAVRKALESGDYRALTQNADVLKLLADPTMRAQLEAAAAAEYR